MERINSYEARWNIHNEEISDGTETTPEIESTIEQVCI